MIITLIVDSTILLEVQVMIKYHQEASLHIFQVLLMIIINTFLKKKVNFLKY
jgi:hypothetical protein